MWTSIRAACLYGAIELTPLDTWEIGGYDIPAGGGHPVDRGGSQSSVCRAAAQGAEDSSSFDPALATTTGFHAGLIHYLLMVLVAVTAVASFESVGNILVVAMFIVPPAAAYMLTDRLGWMIAISVVLAAVSAVLGHVGALVVPALFGYRSTTTAGMMAVAAGVLFLLAAALGPRHGILVKLVRQRLLSWRILAEDVIALLYRSEEQGEAKGVSRAHLQARLLSGRLGTGAVLAWLRVRGMVEGADREYRLTERGRGLAADLIRSHRLWEEYLVARVGVTDERTHQAAERLEHFTTQQLRKRLDEETDAPRVDSHGKPIPSERAQDDQFRMSKRFP